MTKIDIKETEGGGTNPEIIDNKMSDKNREGVSNESGYFEDDDESGAGLNQEDSIEIIFDKNASNNNSANSSDSAECGLDQCRDVLKSHGVSMKDFDLLKVLGTGAYGKVFLVRKIRGPDRGHLYAMKVLKKANIVQKKKTTEHTRTERQVLETVRQAPFLVTMHYAFQTPAKLHLVLDYVSGGELFTHLYQRENYHR